MDQTSMYSAGLIYRAGEYYFAGHSRGFLTKQFSGKSEYFNAFVYKSVFGLDRTFDDCLYKVGLLSKYTEPVFE